MSQFNLDHRAQTIQETERDGDGWRDDAWLIKVNKKMIEKNGRRVASLQLLVVTKKQRENDKFNYPYKFTL